MSLSVGDFAAFHRAIHRRDPFDWQSRLLRRIAENRRWPRTLDLPTGVGKTTCVDIAVFLLALDAQEPPQNRWCPRRVAMVVDRRVVVDQAAERGRAIQRALTKPTDPILVRVNEAMRDLSGTSSDVDEAPLGVFSLRGGIPRDDGWARSPLQPLVIASTVDQLGSRLLMQGYGVSSRMRPVHAGLLANDALILLDEVHLSRPFQQTLEAVANLRRRFPRRAGFRPLQTAYLSATPGEVGDDVFRLDHGDFAKGSALWPRLNAAKPTSIFKVSGREDLATKCVEHVKELVGRHRTVACIVNRVETAASVCRKLAADLGSDDVNTILLTGRMRPLDRDDVVAEWAPSVSAGRIRSPDAKTTIVVATQCIEAGADFDFDAMVSESAPLDALRQRFGRVDRLGAYGESEGVIVHDKSEKDDPIYGTSIAATVEWFEKTSKPAKAPKGREGATATFDFRSISYLGDGSAPPPEVRAPAVDAPTLLPAYLDLWCQTEPEPAYVPDVGLFLHGRDAPRADVQIIWRSDLDEAWFERDVESDDHHAALMSVVGAIPPSALEAVSVPFMVAKRWLAGGNEAEASPSYADVEGKDVDGGQAEGRPSTGPSRRALHWLGDRSRLIDAERLRPGSTIIVPSSRGGIDPRTRTFDPRQGKTADGTDRTGTATVDRSPPIVPDLAERASFVGRGRPVLRLHRETANRLLGVEIKVDDAEDPEAIFAAITAVAPSDGWLGGLIKSVGGPRSSRSVVAAPDGKYWRVLSGRRIPAAVVAALCRATDSVEEGGDTNTDEDQSPFVGTAVTLEDHSSHVEQRARSFALSLGLPREVADDLALAGWLHDVGKADPRFQALLRGGDPVALYRDGGVLLAKSGLPPNTVAERQAAQARSRYPIGARHEVQSLALIEGVRDAVASKAHDVELVLHLVGSHHGYCRPFAPAVPDLHPVDVSLPAHCSDVFGSLAFKASASSNGFDRFDGPLARRFWRLTSKFGWFDLCWLEAVLRLADHRASEAEAGGAT
ncbi:MAG TPA: type I-U CRISPR-associated helicase/endonuclease Cas3 [Planctomycetota bacterium]|nr:type I-U CRISPR-associated helicase/endonuclease Cas3 [Planctomycetota bacterium]